MPHVPLQKKKKKNTTLCEIKIIRYICIYLFAQQKKKNLELMPVIDYVELNKTMAGMKLKDPMVSEDEINKKLKEFKKFDAVQDCSDHHYKERKHGILDTLFRKFKKIDVGRSSEAKVVTTISTDWSKKIHKEWQILQKNLPDSIYVRVYEDRMELMRAAIVGQPGTPYHDGLFFFDIHFPQEYPKQPPNVHYHSRGLRLNPNLYSSGMVCLSLLNTWTGSGTEKWQPETSTMLQVLVSLQALVLNAKPYFNEPGYSRWANTRDGELKSLAYNDDKFILSLKTMQYTLRSPPKHFEDLVAMHFRGRRHAILSACQAYINGSLVGHPDKQSARDVSGLFKRELSRQQKLLVECIDKFLK
ncbi:putative ubiquitin-conjugating enzyme E2 25 [Acorus gramineus]|uniref:E2 ubiquitin-conjugating enzyme n=1 Tax=Acorus gramineus TaxID=55184 RepID=A0AAV9BKH3_ACOGR|nr:putative ubiquitin-conjugating enzyme E2 25 [Acorus gramineus]